MRTIRIFLRSIPDSREEVLGFSISTGKNAVIRLQSDAPSAISRRHGIEKDELFLEFTDTANYMTLLSVT